MTEWDQKLAKIVAETERHLSSVKSQLRGSASGSSSTLRDGYTSLNKYRRNSRTPPPSILRASESGHSSVLLSSGIISPPKRNVSFESSLSPSSSSSTVMLLSDKIREQQREVNSLRESVFGIHSSLRQQQEQLHALREEVRLSRLQLDEDSSSNKMDRKMHKLKDELSKELDQLKRKVQLCSPGVGRSGNHTSSKVLTSLSSDFCEFKLHMDQRLGELEHKLTGLRTDFARQESKVSRVSGSLKTLEKEQEKCAKELNEVKGRQLGEDSIGSGGKLYRSIADLSSEVRKIKQLVGGLELRLTSLEESSLPSKSKPGKKPELFHMSHGPLTSSLLIKEGMGDEQHSASKNDYSGKLSLSGRNNKENPLHSCLGKPLFVGAGHLGASSGVDDGDSDVVGLPMQYLVRTGNTSGSLTSFDGDESTLAGGGVGAGRGNLATDLSLTSMDLSELEDSTFNDVDELVLESDDTLSAGHSL